MCLKCTQGAAAIPNKPLGRGWRGRLAAPVRRDREASGSCAAWDAGTGSKAAGPTGPPVTAEASAALGPL